MSELHNIETQIKAAAKSRQQPNQGSSQIKAAAKSKINMQNDLDRLADLHQRLKESLLHSEKLRAECREGRAHLHQVIADVQQERKERRRQHAGTCW